MFIEYIEWVYANPVYAFVILLVEYAVLFKLYYQPRWKRVAKLAAIPFVIQDAVFNIVVLSVLFLEVPQEILVTARLQRWKLYQLADRRNFIKRTRYDFAWWLCGILNKFNEGHC